MCVYVSRSLDLIARVCVCVSRLLDLIVCVSRPLYNLYLIMNNLDLNMKLCEFFFKQKLCDFFKVITRILNYFDLECLLLNLTIMIYSHILT